MRKWYTASELSLELYGKILPKHTVDNPGLTSNTEFLFSERDIEDQREDFNATKQPANNELPAEDLHLLGILILWVKLKKTRYSTQSLRFIRGQLENNS